MPAPRIAKYLISLYNRNENLDLRKKEREIINTINSIKSEMIGLVSCKIISLEQYHLEISAKENSDRWHTKLGNYLANEGGMRAYCKEDNRSKMFQWTEIM